jgi:hypothetical protein
MIVLLVTLLCSWSFLKCQARDKHEEDCQEKGAEDCGIKRFVCLALDVAIGSWRHADHVDTCRKLDAKCQTQARRRTKLDDYFTKVIWMSRPRKEALITNGTLVARIALEEILLYITNTLHYKPNPKQYHSPNIPSSAKIGLWVLGDIRRVQDSDGQRNGPDPKHLETPEAEKGKELVAFVVKTVVLAGFQDSEEEES